MKIERITLQHVRIPLVEPFKISNGEIREKDGIVVGIAADGHTGYGEASPMAGSFYSEDTPESVWDVLSAELVPRMLHPRPATVEDAHARLERISGSPFAKAGVEAALWDLTAQEKDKPLYVLLGGENRPVASGLAVGIYANIGELLKRIERYMKEGYKRVKIKIQPGWDRKPLESIRKEFDSIPLMVDANCAYTRKDIEHLRSLDEFGLMMIEQPLGKEDLEGHALLQASVQTPVCLDESAEDVKAVQQAIRIKACKIINIKIQRVGGFRQALRIHDLCKEAGIPVWAGTMPELGIGGAQTLHLATLPNFSYPTDVESSRRWFVDDIIEPLIEVKDGWIRIEKGSGNGYRSNSNMINKYKVREAVFVP